MEVPGADLEGGVGGGQIRGSGDGSPPVGPGGLGDVVPQKLEHF